MQRLSTVQHDKLVHLRRFGKSISEISRETGIAITTVQRHIRGVLIPERFLKRLKEKQGGSKDRARGLRENCLEEAKSILGSLTKRDQLMLLLGIYWGEGTKKDLAIINSDPKLLQTFIVGLEDVFSIASHRLSAGLRIHSNLSVCNSKEFWSSTLDISTEVFNKVEVISGKKKGKLPYGMCRVRVRSGIKERILIQTMISLIGKDMESRVLSR